jgi:hypothetical protein
VAKIVPVVGNQSGRRARGSNWERKEGRRKEEKEKEKREKKGGRRGLSQRFPIRAARRAVRLHSAA